MNRTFYSLVHVLLFDRELQIEARLSVSIFLAIRTSFKTIDTSSVVAVVVFVDDDVVHCCYLHCLPVAVQNCLHCCCLHQHMTVLSQSLQSLLSFFTPPQQFWQKSCCCIPKSTRHATQQSSSKTCLNQS